MTVNSALTVDAWQVNHLPLELRDQFLAWLHRVAPPEVARNAFHLAVYEGCVEVTFFCLDNHGRRYVENPHDPPDERYAAQATWQEERCELPPVEAFRLASSFKQMARQL